MANEDLERITILLQAKDKEFARAMDRNNRIMARFAKEAQRGTTEAARTIDTNLKRMVGSAKDFAVGFAGGIAGGLAMGAFDRLTTGLVQTVKGIAQVGDEAKRSGLGLRAFQEWKFVADQNRVSVDALVDGFKELNLRADEWVVTGGGSAAEAFARLGFTAADLKSRLKDPSALMLEIVGRLQNLDEAAQIRIADELFGGTGGEQFVQLLDQGRAGIEQTIDRAHELGVVLDEGAVERAAELDRKFGEIGAKLETLIQRISVGLFDAWGVASAAEPEWMSWLRHAPTLTAIPIALVESGAGGQMLDALSDISDEGGATVISAESAAALRDLEMTVPDMIDGALAMQDELEAVMYALDEIGQTEAADGLERIVLRLDDIIAGAINGSIEADDLQQQLSSVGDEAGSALDQVAAIDGISLGGAIGAVGGLIQVLRMAAGAAAQVRANLPGVDASKLGGLQPDLARFGNPYADLEVPTVAPKTSPAPKDRPFELGVPDLPSGGGRGGGGKGGGGGKASSRYGDGAADWREEIAGLLAEAEALNDLALSYDEYGIAQDVARRKAELLQAAQNDGKTITPELTAEIDKLAASYAEAAQKSELARQRHEEFQDAVDEAKGTLGSAFVGLVTGANSFRDALSNVLGKLAEMMAMKAFEGLWSGGLGDAVGGLLGGLGFATGGYTGPGPRNQIAGAVHAGEMVWSQDDVRRAGGVRAADAIRRGGGMVAAPAASGSGAAPVPVHLIVSPSEYFDARVDDRAGRVVAGSRPGTIRDAVSATDRTMRRSRRFGGGF